MSWRRAAAARLRDRQLPRRRTSWLRHLLLALTLAVVTLGVVGMHQLSVDHDAAPGRSVVSSRAGDVAHPAHNAGATPADHLLQVSGGSASAGAGSAEEACPGCADHQMVLTSCLLALTLLVLTWLLTPPRLRHLPPFLLPRLTAATAGSTLGRLVPSLTLTELSLRRT